VIKITYHEPAVNISAPEHSAFELHFLRKKKEGNPISNFLAFVGLNPPMMGCSWATF
jgi:hypothetical protein